MIEPWILSKLDPLRPAALIILRDPQRMIQPGAYVVHGWSGADGHAVFFAKVLELRKPIEIMWGQFWPTVLWWSSARSAPFDNYTGIV